MNPIRRTRKFFNRLVDTVFGRRERHEILHRLARIEKRLKAVESRAVSPAEVQGSLGRRIDDVGRLVLGKKVRGRILQVERDVKALLRHAYLSDFQAVPPNDLIAARFGLMSQNEEDGVLLELLRRVGEDTRKFVEVGCGINGGNSGFLARDLGWSGLMIDADPSRANRARWKFGSPRVTCIESLVTRENIQKTLSEHDFDGEIDVLSIDIDGNDYWIWEAITETRPRVAVIEYNSLFGPDRAVTIPYDPQFDRSAHDERKLASIYYGASLSALARLASTKGFRLVTTEPSGVNAFFVRNDLAPEIPESDPREVFRIQYGYARKGFDVYEHARELGLPLIDLEQQETDPAPAN